MEILRSPLLTRRVVLESALVEGDYPGAFRLTVTPRGLPAWIGAVPVEGQAFPVRLIYPIAYPAVPPLLATSLPLPGNCPHVLAREAEWATLCWIAPGLKRLRGRWDPTRHTAATALRAAQRWGLALLVWQATHEWPVPDAWEAAP